MNAIEIELPELGSHAINGQLGEARVEVVVLELGQLYERRSGLDFGIDGVIELVTDREPKRASGRQVGVQVKRGLSVVKATRHGRTLYCTEQHANYWLGHSLPIIIVHCEPESDRLRWQHVNKQTIRETMHGFAIDLPEDSDLRSSLAELRTLATTIPGSAAVSDEVLIIPYDPQRGVTAPADELGLAALAFSRAALRGARYRIEIEFEGEAELVASIDMIEDMRDPSQDQRREAVVRQDILHRFRKHATRLRRALTLLLTNPMIAETFGYQEQWLADAILNAAPPMFDRTPRGTDAYLEAWPGYHTEQPTVRFEVPQEAMEDFYARDPMNRALIWMGSAGGTMIGDLPGEVIATRFLPALANRIVTFADAQELRDDEVLTRVDVLPNYWLVGVA